MRLLSSLSRPSLPTLPRPSGGANPKQPVTRAKAPSTPVALTPASAQTLAAGEQGVGALRAVQPVTDGNQALVPSEVKIGLAVAQPSANVSFGAPLTVNGVTLQAGQPYTVRAGAQGGIELADGSGQVLVQGASPLRLASDADHPISLNGSHYRGAIEILNAPGQAGKITAVNDVALEDYLKGVLPAEMATGWPQEALKSQAVAARTYAAANVGRHADQGFDLFPTTADQMYKGRDAEAPDTTAAVEATSGQIMTYNGQPIDALFFSSSGGSSDDAMAVWGMDLPYIKAVPDPDTSPNAHWTTTLTPASVRTALAKMGVDVGTPSVIQVSGRTPGGRARNLQIAGDRGAQLVDANQFRLAIGLKSTRIQIQKTGGNWQVDGGGYGHGLGMSQWGARAKAQAGQDYRTILTNYYTGIRLTDGQ